MPALATTAELAHRLADFDPDSASDQAKAEALLEQASAYLLAETGQTVTVVEGAGTPAELSVYGSGTAYLYVGPHVGTIAAEDVETASGYEVPDFVDRGDYLVATDETGNLYPSRYWPRDILYTVTAVWGVSTVAGDLKSAVLDLAAHWYEQSYAERPARTVPESVTRFVERTRYERAWGAQFA
jgi:hypothetical protein